MGKKYHLLILTTLSLSILFVFPRFLFAANQISITASADPNPVMLQQGFRYQIQIHSKVSIASSRPILNFPKEAFRFEGGPSVSNSSNISFINGTVSQEYTYTYSYQFSAKKKGSFQFSPSTLNVGGKQYQSNLVKVEVGKAPENSKLSGDFVFQLKTKKKKYYVDQQIILTAAFYSRYQMDGYQLQMPSLAGFKAHQIGKTNIFRQRIQNRVYLVVQSKFSLFAQTPGKQTIPPFTFKFRRGVFSGLEQFNSNQITLQIKDVPLKGRPSGFSDAVGTYQIQSSLNASKVQTGNGVELTIRIKGRGNIRSITSLPAPKVPGANVFPSDKKYNEQYDLKGMYGNYSEQFLIIPKSAGKYKIPPLRFSYFDPVKEKFIRAQSSSQHFKASGDANALSSNTFGTFRPKALLDLKKIGGLRTIHSSLHAASFSKKSLWKNSRFRLFHLLLALISIYAVLHSIWQKKLASDPLFARSLNAFSAAMEKIRQAQKLIKKDEKGSCALLSQAIRGFLCDVCHFPSSDISITQTEQLMKEYQIHKDRKKEVLEFLKQCDLYRFSPQGESFEGDPELLSQAKLILKKLNKKSWKKRKKIRMAFIALFISGLCFFPSISHASSDIHDFQEANQAYLQGNYFLAKNLYQHLLDRGMKNASLYYNLGNTFFRLKKPGIAILNYRRALKQNPHDKDTMANLKFVRRRRLNRIQSPEMPLLFRLRSAFYQKLSYRDFAYLSLFLSSLLALSLIAWSWKESKISRYGVFLSMFLFLIYAYAFYSFDRFQKNQKEAVVMNTKIEAHADPILSSKTQAVLYEGDEITITRKEGDWDEISLEGIIIGWIPDEGIQGI